MEKRLSWEAKRFSASQEIPHILWQYFGSANPDLKVRCPSAKCWVGTMKFTAVEERIREKIDNDALEKCVCMKWNDNYFGMKGKERTWSFPVTLTVGGRLCPRHFHWDNQEIRTQFSGSNTFNNCLKGLKLCGSGDIKFNLTSFSTVQCN